VSKAASDTLEKVSGEFEAEVLADLESGRKDTNSAVESVRKETEETVAKILETSIKQAESVKRQIIGAAELEARNTQLKALEKAVNAAFEAASKEITDLSGARHDDAIRRLIQEGLDVIGPKAKVGCASKDRRSVASAIKKLGPKARVSLDDGAIESAGGVILTTSDGSVRFDNTFEARLERMKPSLRKDVAAVLTAT
jgi:V/A-type H+-transporting ATPase subunit E